MPVWICAVVGAGLWKPLPGVVAVALAGISPAGVEPRWHVSHVVDDGMCEPAPTGEVGGITMILVTPTKLDPVIVGAWHAAQLFVIPLWLILEPENFAPSPTGVAAMLEPAPTWHCSHGAEVGTWFAGGPTIEKPADGIANPATTAAPWHCAQLPVVLGALAWMLANVGSTEKSVDVWHDVHCALADVGMWLAGLSWAVK